MATIKRVGQIIYSAWVWALLALMTVVVCLPIFIGALLDPTRQLPHIFGMLWAKAIVRGSFWKLKIRGRGYLRKKTAYVLVANHSSLTDILFAYFLGKQFKWMAKDSLFKIPIFGWCMSAMGYIPLKRGRHGSVRDSFQESVKWINRGISVLIFPEGTRSRDGKPGAFKNGAFKLALRTRAPIVPIVLTGTREAIQKGSGLFSPRVFCNIKVLKPIPTAGYGETDVGDLRERVRSEMVEALRGPDPR